MRVMSGVQALLHEDLTDLANHIRINYAYQRMTVEELEQALAVYTMLVDMVLKLEQGELH